ncbi:cbb3-type cytochrome c oxidase N-terminal domain-containing protein [Salegentibacter chungangensis]|uniref:Cbb3-type cytochrome c oxidase N-terminal domain-containing protein n=1 Tax=Salegentibacter chungangensis TaxID=1335724 RepID=A0ABW3NS86_9FLAO
MKNTFSYLRIIGFLALAAILMEITVETGDQSAVLDYPLSWLILAIVLVIAIAIEVSVSSLRNLLYRGLTPEARAQFDAEEAERKASQFGWLKKLYASLLNKKPIEKEDEIILDHNYDGIKELDNDLPSWWLYGFYISIVFAGIYMARYHIFDGESQKEEFQTEMAQAKAAVEEYKKNAPDLIDASSVELITDAGELEKGKTIFNNNCAACHRADGGGGIGPNLTDEHWILGGGISNIFSTISEGGRDGKGMVAWKSSLSPSEIAQVSSYVISLQGTNPEDAKEAQGDIIWTKEKTSGASSEEASLE